MDKKLLVRYAIRVTINLVGMGVALFWAAGRLDWWPAWAALGVMLFWLAAMPVVSLRANPALLADYLGSRKGAPRWDAAIVSLLGLVQLIRYIIAGLDQRYGWTGGFPLGVQLAAFVVCLLGYVLFIWATASNAFFAQSFRIQGERGHTVASGGPYRYVRHPAYAGAIAYELAVAFLFASWLSFIPTVLCAFLLILRTAFEDRALQAELPGYAGFAQKVKYRLLPGVW